VLASLVCLRARLRFEDGQNAAAIDDIIAAMTLGRHISRDGINVTLLAGNAIEYRVTEALALYLPRLNSTMIKDLKTRLDALPKGGTPAASLRGEEKWALNWFIRAVRETKDRDSLLTLLTPLTDSEGKGSPEKARAFLEKSGGVEGVLKYAEETRACYVAMERSLDLPLDQFQKDWEVQEAKLAGNPVFKVIFPAVAKLRWSQARTDVRRALLSAALAVRLEGPAALKNHPDPIVGGPFEYVPFEGGFKLRSSLKADDNLRAKWKLDEWLTTPLEFTAGPRGK
jgi:hypothetical protein